MIKVMALLGRRVLLMSVLQPDAGKIAMDIVKKTASAAKTAANMATQPEAAGKISADIAKKAAKSGIGKVTQVAQEAGQGIST